MPNTLAHLGVNVLATRGVLRGADLKWIWAGCILPDLPWIAQRIARMALPDAWAIDIRSYATAQSSLFVTLILCAALALLSHRPARTFQILALGALLHLLLDATQTKWGNGVVLFAPLDWRWLNFGWYWPEDAATWLLSTFGAAQAIWAFTRETPEPARLPRSGWRLGVAGFVLLAYLAAPLAMIPAVEQANLHFARTLQGNAERTGQLIEVDRNRVTAQVLHHWTGEEMTLSGNLPDQDATISLKGEFQAPGHIHVAQYHVHPTGLRDYLSYIGLLIVLVWWMRAARR